MELALSICLGISLAAACGFRVFVPLLGLSAASLSGHLDLADSFEWIATWPALACLLTATIAEVAAYYIPWVDNALDSIATPAAAVAGTMAMASVVTDMSPLMQWSLALIAGGGTAAAVQGSTVALRGTSTATTAGIANPLLSTLELVLSVCTTILALLVPVLTVLLIVILALLGTLLLRRKRLARQRTASASM